MSGEGSLPNAFGRELSRAEIARGDHRDFVGGLWDQLGALQLDFMIRQGLRPDMTFLDLGCGCLRGGLHFIRHLARGNYFGIDANASLVRSAWEVEPDRITSSSCCLCSSRALASAARQPARAWVSLACAALHVPSSSNDLAPALRALSRSAAMRRVSRWL